jgi:hypothetical protein
VSKEVRPSARDALNRQTAGFLPSYSCGLWNTTHDLVHARDETAQDLNDGLRGPPEWHSGWSRS